ncbi:MAG: hypothetical protein ACPGVU_05020 [Limisphaerales bacterium]
MKNVTLLATLLLLLFNRADAQNASASPSTNTFTSKLLIEREGLKVLGYRSLIEFNSNKFAAILPTNFRVQSDRQRHRIVAQSEDKSCVLSLSFTNAIILEKDEELDHKYLESRLAGQFQGAKALGESWQFALEDQAPTFDLLRKTAAGEIHKIRVSFIGTAKALITVSMTSSQDRFDNHAFTFADLLASLLQAGKDGELEINPLSNKL